MIYYYYIYIIIIIKVIIVVHNNSFNSQISCTILIDYLVYKIIFFIDQLKIYIYFLFVYSYGLQLKWIILIYLKLHLIYCRVLLSNNIRLFKTHYQVQSSNIGRLLISVFVYQLPLIIF